MCCMKKQNYWNGYCTINVYSSLEFTACQCMAQKDSRAAATVRRDTGHGLGTTIWPSGFDIGCTSQGSIGNGFIYNQ